jgi:hypothetical protein
MKNFLTNEIFFGGVIFLLIFGINISLDKYEIQECESFAEGRATVTHQWQQDQCEYHGIIINNQ